MKQKKSLTQTQYAECYAKVLTYIAQILVAIFFVAALIFPIFWEKNNITDMRYDKNGLPIKEYYTEELKKPTKDKMKALIYQKYYTGGAIVLMFVVLFIMYVVLY